MLGKMSNVFAELCGQRREWRSRSFLLPPRAMIPRYQRQIEPSRAGAATSAIARRRGQ
jgi:hypothetical protein